jgi:hypothetical protein
MHDIEFLRYGPKTEIDNKLVMARPYHQADSFLSRLKDAIGVLNHKYDAVKFHKQ